MLSHAPSIVLRLVASVLVITSLASTGSGDEAGKLFNGKSLDGWETIDQDAKWWTVKDGAIAGGDESLKVEIPHNTFLATQESYGDFKLRLKVRIRGSEGFVNSGIQIRSVRVDGSSEMSGYQVDIGEGWWGKLYDESRRNKVISESKDLAKVSASIKKDDWNEIRIEAIGPRIRTWVNDVPAIDYTEEDESISQEGKIGLQVHGAGKTFVEFKDIEIYK